MSYVDPNTVILTLEGEFDALAVAEARPMLEGIVTSSAANVVMDFSRVGFLDSSGVGCLVFLFKRLYAGKRTLTLEGLRDQPQRLIQSLRIDKAIPTRASSAAA
ncbi:MAG TPA: STAS domain-containing protein [Aliidongia sp.]|nr:STAS domain-containing protein [Aliidongia sp.]